MVLFEDEVCFREWVPCGGQGLIEDGVIMAAMLQSNRPSYILCRTLQRKEPLKIKKGSEEHKAI